MQLVFEVAMIGNAKNQKIDSDSIFADFSAIDIPRIYEVSKSEKSPLLIKRKGIAERLTSCI